MSPEPSNPESPDTAQPQLGMLRTIAVRIKPGEVFDGRYEIVSKLGEGGICEVYKGTHKQLNQTTAIKVLRPQFVQDPDVRERFSREAKALAHLKHPGIVEIFSVGEADGAPFIAMEFLDGGSLTDLIKSQPSGCLPIDRALELFIQIAAAMRHAHENGIIHRDLKPDNVMLTQTGQVKIVDFGLSKAVEASNVIQTLTATGAVVGTVLYMSPEQCLGRKVDAQSDIYSLGCLMYEALTGAPPFNSEVPYGVLAMHLRDAPEENEKLGSLQNIVFRCLAKDPADRPTSAQLVDWLQAPDNVTPRGYKAPKKIDGKKVRIGVMASLCLVAAVLALVTLANPFAPQREPLGEIASLKEQLSDSVHRQLRAVGLWEVATPEEINAKLLPVKAEMESILKRCDELSKAKLSTEQQQKLDDLRTDTKLRWIVTSGEAEERDHSLNFNPSIIAMWKTIPAVANPEGNWDYKNGMFFVAEAYAQTALQKLGKALTLPLADPTRRQLVAEQADNLHESRRLHAALLVHREVLAPHRQSWPIRLAKINLAEGNLAECQRNLNDAKREDVHRQMETEITQAKLDELRRNTAALGR